MTACYTYHPDRRLRVVRWIQGLGAGDRCPEPPGDLCAGAVAVYATDDFGDDGKAREVRQCVGGSARTDTLAYDIRGRLTAWRTAASGPLGDDADETAHFRRYDALDQVTSEDAARWPLGRNDFPDDDGALPGRAPLDRTAERSFERVHSDGVVERVRGRVSGQLVELTPDAAGRSTTHTERYRALDLSRDAQGRPVRDAYDAEGRRLGTAQQGEALVYDAYGLVEHTRAGATRVFAPPLPGVQLSRRADGQWEAALLTPTQTPLAAIGNGGATRMQALYSPTGEATEARPANDTWPYPKTRAGYVRYPDRGQFGETAGLYDAGARLYAPTWGQFLAGDPVLPEADVPESWGRYAYGGGDTVGRWDPDGRFAWLISGGIGAAIGGGLGFAACAIQGGDDCLNAAGIGAAAGFVSGATFGLAQMAGAGAVAAGAASGGAGGFASGTLSARAAGADWSIALKSGGRSAIAGALGGAAGGAFTQFLTGGVTGAAFGRQLLAEVGGNLAGEVIGQAAAIGVGEQEGFNLTQLAISAGVGFAPAAWHIGRDPRLAREFKNARASLHPEGASLASTGLGTPIAAVIAVARVGATERINSGLLNRWEGWKKYKAEGHTMDLREWVATRAQLTERLQAVVDRVSARMAEDPLGFVLQKRLLSRAELRVARQVPWLAKMFYGTALERAVRDAIAVDPVLETIFQHVGGAGRADFVGVGRLRGFNFGNRSPWVTEVESALKFGASFSCGFPRAVLRGGRGLRRQPHHVHRTGRRSPSGACIGPGRRRRGSGRA